MSNIATPASDHDLDFLAYHRERVEAALGTVSRRHAPGGSPGLLEPVEYALSTSGKRLRPILCIAAYCASREGEGEEEVPEAMYRLSCAVEIVHTYSLVHDDLPCMDDDDLRRGRPTVHTVFGVPRATLAGAALLPLAMDLLAAEGEAMGLDATARGALAIELARAAGAAGMVAGQILDLGAEGKRLGASELERIHLLKTGALLTGSLRIGALAGSARAPLVDALTRYGHALGLAFQIADDLLDVEGDSAEIGKVPGRDAALSKASYPSLYGVEGARSLAERKVAEAKEAIAGFPLPDLGRIADYVIERRR